MEITIIIQPISFELTVYLLSSLEQKLSKAFDAITKVLPSIKQTLLPPSSFDNKRGQWKSDEILNWLLYKNKPDKSTIMLASCDFDAYSDGLNFVFGQAHVFGRVSAIYLPRLRPEFYGLKTNNSLFHQRITKEAVHELGHVRGLNHCNKPTCVMYFSNSLSDTDIKEDNFCDSCRTRL
ncbi:MAG: archaemetzincin family Zn-dependent metalloprotease [Candidatus Nitrosopolaris sp.]